MSDNTLPPDIQARQKFFKDCQSVECKKQMLGPYVDLFKKEELEGVKNPQVNCKDPINKPICSGLSAAVLYRQLLIKLKKRLNEGTRDTPWVVPWSKKPIRPDEHKNLEEMITDLFEELHIKLACYNQSARSELMCYGLFILIDPLAAAGIYAKIHQTAKATKLTIPREVQTSSAQNTSRLDGNLTSNLDNRLERRGSDAFTERRKTFMENYSEKQIIPVEKKLKYLALSEKITPGFENKKIKFLTIETDLRKLNNTLKKEDLVTGMSTYRHELQLVELKKLESEIRKTNPNFKISTEFSNYNSLKLTLEGDMPADIIKRINDAQLKAQLKFDLDAKARFGLIRATDNSDDWFRTSISGSDDKASLGINYAKETRQEPWKTIDTENDPQFKKWTEEKLKSAQIIKKELEGDLKNTSLLQATSDGDKVLSTKAFDILQKNKDDLPRARQLLMREFGLSNLSVNTVQKIKNYTDISQTFIPGLRGIQREFATLREAPFGGISADMIGLKADNTQRAAMDINKAKDVNEALRQARQGQTLLTAEIEKRRSNFKEVIGSQFSKQEKENLRVSCSGDGCSAYLTHRALTTQEIQKIGENLARSGESGRMRLSAIEKIDDKDFRDLTKKRGEDLEKMLRPELLQRIDPNLLNGLTFTVRMSSQKPEIFIGEANGVRLTSAQKKVVQEEFEKLIRKNDLGK